MKYNFDKYLSQSKLSTSIYFGHIFRKPFDDFDPSLKEYSISINTCINCALSLTLVKERIFTDY